MADLQEQARGTATDAIDQGKAMLTRQKEAAAERVEQVAQAVRSGARELTGRAVSFGRRTSTG